jgi:hypothetical protein
VCRNGPRSWDLWSFCPWRFVPRPSRFCTTRRYSWRARNLECGVMPLGILPPGTRQGRARQPFTRTERLQSLAEEMRATSKHLRLSATTCKMQPSPSFHNVSFLTSDTIPSCKCHWGCHNMTMRILRPLTAFCTSGLVGRVHWQALALSVVVITNTRKGVITSSASRLEFYPVI